MNRSLPVSCRGQAADRDRSPVAARGPRRNLGIVTDALVLARPLRAGTARGPNLIVRVITWAILEATRKGLSAPLLEQPLAQQRQRSRAMA
jgi:hypothetical protein